MVSVKPTTELPAAKAGNLAEQYRRVREQSIALARPLEPEDCVIQTIPEVSPTKWHLAHVTWFFETFCLAEYADAYQPYDEQYHYLFNSYYYSVGEMHRRPQRGLLSRPLLREVLDYRRYVDDAMLELIARDAGNSRLAFLITLGLNHEQQHQELLLTDIKHVLFANPRPPVYAEPGGTNSTGLEPMRFVERSSGIFPAGAEGNGFCFDNETPRHDVLIGEHALANRLVTNGEYRRFIDEGSYSDSRLWLSDGWATIQEESWSRPLYWAEDLETEFTLGGWLEVEPDRPVCHLSFYEADAFARWAGARLPTEFEWELSAADSRIEGNTLDKARFHPRAPDSSIEAIHGLCQLWGDVWEWTSSPYVPYPRFEPLAGSLGEYNGKFMANQMVVRGGSCASWADHLRATYRSFFYPRDRWQFLGLRLAKDV